MKIKLIMSFIILLIVVAYNIIVPTYCIRDYGIESSLSTVNETDMSDRVNFEASRQASEWVYILENGIGLIAILLLWSDEIKKGLLNVKQV